METRERIIEAAAKLVAEGGIEAASTRAVTAAAGVQAPTLYRLFGDKQGLLDAVAAHGFDTYLVSKQAQLKTDDPIADVGAGFDLHVEFGLANFLKKNLGKNDHRVEESRGEWRDHFPRDKKLRDTRGSGAAYLLLEAQHQIRASRPGAIEQAA